MAKLLWQVPPTRRRWRTRNKRKNEMPKEALLFGERSREDVDECKMINDARPMLPSSVSIDVRRCEWEYDERTKRHDIW